MGKMKVFISQTPKRKTTDGLREEEARIVSKLKERYDEDIEVVSASAISASAEGNPLYVLAKVIEALSTADIAIFTPGWSKQMSVEMDAARTYGVPIVDYDDLFYDELPRYVVDSCDIPHEVRPLSDEEIKALNLHRNTEKHPVIAVNSGNLATYYGNLIYWENLRPRENWASMKLCKM